MLTFSLQNPPQNLSSIDSSGNASQHPPPPAPTCIAPCLWQFGEQIPNVPLQSITTRIEQQHVEILISAQGRPACCLTPFATIRPPPARESWKEAFPVCPISEWSRKACFQFALILNWTAEFRSCFQKEGEGTYRGWGWQQWENLIHRLRPRGGAQLPHQQCGVPSPFFPMLPHAQCTHESSCSSVACVSALSCSPSILALPSQFYPMF